MRDYFKSSHNQINQQKKNNNIEHYKFQKEEFIKEEKNLKQINIQQKQTTSQFDLTNIFQINNNQTFKKFNQKIDYNFVNKLVPQIRSNLVEDQNQDKEPIDQIIKINKNIEDNVEIIKDQIKKPIKFQQDQQVQQQQQDQQQEEQQQKKDKIKQKTGYKRFSGISQNITKLDKKGKYRESVRGALYINKTRYTKNGRLKETKNAEKYRKLKERKEEGKVDLADESKNDNVIRNINQNDLYMQSLSKAFKVELIFENNNIQQQKQLEIRKQQLIEMIKQKEIEEIVNRELMDQILQTFFNFCSFINDQYESIVQILLGNNILNNSYTGSGKSLIFQLVSLILRIKYNSLGIVLCPTISLCLNHVQNLPECLRGAAYTSAIKFNQKLTIKNYIKQQQLDILFICPEVMQVDMPELFLKIKIAFICIDEAHQIIQNQRISYQLLPSIINQIHSKNNFPIILLTASANHQIRKDLMLKMNVHQQFIGQLFRTNQIITVSKETDKLSSLISLLQQVEKKNDQSRIIVFCGSIFLANRVNWFLQNNFYDSSVYHSFVDKQDQIHIINKFIDDNFKYQFNKTKIIVTTSIFSMGLDIKNINGIIFFSGIKNFEEFVQSLGRGARMQYIEQIEQFDDLIIDFQNQKQQQKSDNNNNSNNNNNNNNNNNKQTFQGFAHVFMNKDDYNQEKNKIEFDYYNYQIAVRQILAILNQKEETFVQNIDEVSQKINLRKEQLFMILTFMRSCNIIDDFLISHRYCTVKFYKHSIESLAKDNDLIKYIQENAKKNQGSYKVDMVLAVKKMKRQHNEILYDLHEMQKQRFISMDMSEEVVQLRMKEKLKIDNYNEIESRIFDYLLKEKDHHIFNLDCVYLVMSKISFPRVDYLIKNKYSFGQLKLENEEENVIMKYNKILSQSIDEYFRQQQSNLKPIVNDDFLLINARIQFDFNQETQEIQQALQDNINQQLAQELSYTFQDDMLNLQQIFKNPVYLTSVLFAILSPLVQWKHWNHNSLWNKYSKFQFTQIYHIVSTLVSDFMLNNNIKFKAIIQ